MTARFFKKEVKRMLRGLRFWLAWTALAIAVAVAVYVLSGTTSTSTVAVSSPTRTAAPVASPSATATPSGTPRVTTSSIPTPTPTPTPISIPGSAPVELYFPAFDAHVPMDDKSCPVNSEGSWEPDQTKPQAACYVKDATHPYVWPATVAPDLTVIAGHTGQQVKAAFNLLYDWHTQQFAVKANDEVWVKTVSSGTRWLVYKATQFYTPDKYGARGLEYDTDVWGTAPQPNTLITIGCLQPQTVGVETTRNIVIKWAYVGVKN